MKSKMLEWTSEIYLPFVDPEICGAKIQYEHLHRYYFALHFVKNKEVLDLACGEGYGSYILSKFTEYTVGIDFDEKIIKSKMLKNFINAFKLKIHFYLTGVDCSERAYRRGKYDQLFS